MKLFVIAGLATLAFAGASSAAAPPPGATALCRDGSYSFSKHHSGTCSHHGGVAKWLDGSSTTTISPSSTAGASSPALGRTVLVSARTRSSVCVRGPLPDRRCSPGAYYSGLTKPVLCSSRFSTSSVRDVPQSEKYAVEREYGKPAQLYGRTIEIDHIIPLELGGSNNIANLFFEPGAGTASYHAKDRLENKLRALVCSGSMTLHAAQVGIATNWETLYKGVFGTTVR